MIDYLNELQKLLADVDYVIAEYGIDTLGTSSTPVSKEEQDRVDAIVAAACARNAARRS